MVGEVIAVGTRSMGNANVEYLGGAKIQVVRGELVLPSTGQRLKEGTILTLPNFGVDLRARDHHAVETLMYYQKVCERNDCNELHIAGSEQVIRKFIEFSNNHPERMKQPGITRHLKLES